MVPAEGLEPPLPCENQILSLVPFCSIVFNRVKKYAFMPYFGLLDFLKLK